MHSTVTVPAIIAHEIAESAFHEVTSTGDAIAHMHGPASERVAETRRHLEWIRAAVELIDQVGDGSHDTEVAYNPILFEACEAVLRDVSENLDHGDDLTKLDDALARATAARDCLAAVAAIETETRAGEDALMDRLITETH